MNLDNERKAFEEWAQSKGWSIARSTEPNYTHKYREAITQCAWESWIASASREGYKLVPVDSLKEIIDCAHCFIGDRCIGDEGDLILKHIQAMGIEDDH